ncbi:RNA polymerase sigma factor [Saccharothrix deserti]|uniref:RNA polymerase sigma factor n=1 Tax=Saccharothrix deserti TaxID=2593674 RepID=UPI00131E917C|nr:sigma-70 family RNA polymerase sigma factor [Saccharothrix deserti]
MDITALLAAAARGDQGAWNTLVERYNGLVWSIARGYRLSTDDAADVVQATWVKLVEHLDRVEDPERLASWLATTVRRESLQLIRRTARQRRAPDGEPLEQLPDPGPALDESLLVEERDAALWRALAALSERCQRLLRVLMASPPPAYAEVADALDMPIGSIGPTRQRCLGRLREVVRDDELLGVDWKEDRS